MSRHRTMSESDNFQVVQYTSHSRTYNIDKAYIDMTSRVVNARGSYYSKWKNKRMRIVSCFGQHIQYSFGLTWNDIPTTTARPHHFPVSMPPGMGSFPPSPPHLPLLLALTGRVRPRASMVEVSTPTTTTDVMGSGACYPECSGLRHVPVIIVRSWDNRLWDYYTQMRNATGYR